VTRCYSWGTAARPVEPAALTVYIRATPSGGHISCDRSVIPCEGNKPIDPDGFVPTRRQVMNAQTIGQTIAAPRPAISPLVVTFWSVTVLFCVQIGFTAYAQLSLPQVAAAFAHLGFPDYFRVELAWAKLVGVVVLLAPVPARLKEWAYAGFAITLGSARISRWAMARRHGGGRQALGCSGRCRTSPGAGRT
jgi:hypothetical protein